MAAAMALNLLLGFTGQISIGHSAFFGIGAYTTGDPRVAMTGGARGCTFPLAFVDRVRHRRARVALPASRIKGVYLALVTLALGAGVPARWSRGASSRG